MRSVSSGSTLKTPNPSWGMELPSLSSIWGTVISLSCHSQLTFPSQLLRLLANVPLLYSRVGGERANEGVRSGLLHDVGSPPGDTAGDEQRGEHVGVEPDEIVGGTAREVEVGLDVLAARHCRFKSVIQLHHVGTIKLGDERFERRLHRGHP